MRRGAFVRLGAILRGRSATSNPSPGEAMMIDMWRTFGAWWASMWPAVVFPWGMLVIMLLIMRVDRPIQHRTDKAKEKFADGLMSMSRAIQNAIAIGILIFPFTAYLQAFVRGIDPIVALQTWTSSARLTLLHLVGLVVSFSAPFLFAQLFRRRALNLYDDIARKSWP
jgi:hypothetical protein